MKRAADRATSVAATLLDRVLVTGANGYVGAAVVRALKEAGFKHVAGLVRREQAKVQAATDAGADDVIVVQCLDSAALAHVARGFRVCIHTATSTGDAAFDAAVDRLIREAMPQDGVYVYTSGNLVCGAQDMVDDEDAPLSAPLDFARWRLGVEAEVLKDGASGSRRTAIVRPGFVYGGDARSDFLVRRWLDGAERTGSAEVYGDGGNALPIVHVDDLARLYVLVLLSPTARGVFHALEPPPAGAGGGSAAGPPPTTRQLAQACSDVAGTGGVRLTPIADVAADYPPGFADAFGLSQRLGCAKSLELKWAPRPFDAAAAHAELKAAREAAAAFAAMEAAAASVSIGGGGDGE